MLNALKQGATKKKSQYLIFFLPNLSLFCPIARVPAESQHGKKEEHTYSGITDTSPEVHVIYNVYVIETGKE
jgi:hypothetical protein